MYPSYVDTTAMSKKGLNDNDISNVISLADTFLAQSFAEVTISDENLTRDTFNGQYKPFNFDKDKLSIKNHDLNDDSLYFS